MPSSREYAEENIEIYRWIRDEGHLDFLAKAALCDEYVRGDQWDAGVKAKLARRRKPTLTINKVLATYATLLGQQIDRRGDVSFRPSSGGQIETARALDKLWIHFTQQNNYDWIESCAFSDGIIRSRGYIDLRISYDDSMRADPVASYLNSKDVGLYPGDSGSDPDRWQGVMLSRWLCARDIAEIYGVKLNDVMIHGDADALDSDLSDWKRDTFGTVNYSDEFSTLDDTQRSKYRMLRVLERQEWVYKTVPCFVEPATGEVREIPTTWDRERIQLAIAQFGYNVISRRVKKINWVVSVGNLGLHNSVSPYKHFTVVPYFPFQVGGNTLGIVEHLIDPQNLLNKTLSQELHIVAGIANSGFKVRSGALSNMTTEQLQERGGEDGIVIEVNGDLNAVEKLQPNQVPTGLDRLSYKAGEVMQEISLVNDSMQGLNRADESGRAIERKASQGSGALTPIYTALDNTRRIVARNWLDLVQAFVTEQRVYNITSRARFADPEQVEVNKEQFDGSFLNDLTVGEYGINVTNTQSRSSADLEQFDIMMQMIRQGAPIPWSDIVSNLTVLENRQEIVEFLKGQEGRNDPSEASQKREELELRLLEAQAADKESSAAVKMAGADRTRVDAQQKMQAGDPMQLEAYKAEQNAQIKMREAEDKARLAEQKAQLDVQLAQAKLEFERQKMQMDLQQAREKHQLEMSRLTAQIEAQQMQAQVSAQAAIHQANIKAQASEQQSQAKIRNAEHQMSMKSMQSELQMESQRQQAEMKAKQMMQQKPKQPVDNTKKE